MDFPLIDGFSMKEAIHFWGISSIFIGFSMKEAIQRAWGTPLTMETPRSLQDMTPTGSSHNPSALAQDLIQQAGNFWAIGCFTNITMATVDGPAKSVHHQFFQWETSKHPMILCFNHPIGWCRISLAHRRKPYKLGYGAPELW